MTLDVSTSKDDDGFFRTNGVITEGLGAFL